MPDNRAATIVLIEDDPGHARLIERNLSRAQIANTIIPFADGQQALEYLFHTRAYASAIPRTPLLILLDLNLPGLDGYQLLECIKTDQRTRHIPIIILTTTDDPREIERCYALGCNLYLTKPVDYEQFAGSIRSLGLLLSYIKIPQGA